VYEHISRGLSISKRGRRTEIYKIGSLGEMPGLTLSVRKNEALDEGTLPGLPISKRTKGAHGNAKRGRA